MIKGCSIDNNRVEEIVERANLIIAHNAGFDRKIVEKQFPIFKKKPWACTCTQIPWSKEGITSTKLEYLAYKFNFFYEAHRAEIDCLAGINILTQLLSISGNSVLNVLLENARLTTHRV